MSLIAMNKHNDSAFVPVPAGMHLARCYRIIDLGTQLDTYKGSPPALRRKVRLQFEIHSEADDGTPIVTSKGDPMVTAKTYTLSLGPKASLRKDLVSWRGRDFTYEEEKGFEVGNILNAWFMLSIGAYKDKDGKDRTGINNINPVPPAVKKAGLPEGVNKAFMFSLNNFDAELFESLNGHVKETIMGSPEYAKVAEKEPVKAKGSFADMEDDIPF